MRRLKGRAPSQSSVSAPEANQELRWGSGVGAGLWGGRTASRCQEVQAQEVVGWGLGILPGWAGPEEAANKMLSLWVYFFLPAPQSTWCSLALGPGPFVVAESEHRGQDNSWGLIAGQSVLLEVSGAPKLELREPEEKWNHPAKPRRVTTSAMRADLAQTDGKQKQGERIEDEPTF